MELKNWSIFNRTTGKQELVTYALVVPVLAYFVIANLKFAQRNLGMLMALVAAVSVLTGLIGVIQKYLVLRPLLRCLRLMSDGRADEPSVRAAVASVYRFPRTDMINTAVRWIVFANLFVLGPFIAAGLIDPEEALVTFTLISLNGVVTGPLFYLIAQSEGRRHAPAINDAARRHDRHVEVNRRDDQPVRYLWCDLRSRRIDHG